METKTPTTVAGGARDHELLPLLLVGLSIEAIADRLSLGVSTVQRRIADPAFHLLVIEAKNDLIDRCLAATLTSALQATGFLSAVVRGEHDEATMKDRIRAAVALRSGLVTLDAHVSRPTGTDRN